MACVNPQTDSFGPLRLIASYLRSEPCSYSGGFTAARYMYGWYVDRAVIYLVTLPEENGLPYAVSVNAAS